MEKRKRFFVGIASLLFLFGSGTISLAQENSDFSNETTNVLIGPEKQDLTVQPKAVMPPTRIWMTETRTFSFPPAAIYTGWKHYTGYYYRGYLGLRDYNYVPGNAYVFEGWLYRSDLPYPIPSIAPINDLQNELIGSEINE
ncbi:hypothetical protein [Vagococcus fluvialis]|uniref:hypothetical protein n=1 Tax=Vagococcus fluvialis TaxID=2738 RepID=UPI001A8EB002|nr:hypothetical protein [Vagococcus fluvialis]MBO0442274.1 hypothetical protein [Vagococcus fluvialis]